MGEEKHITHVVHELDRFPRGDDEMDGRWRRDLEETIGLEEER